MSTNPFRSLLSDLDDQLHDDGSALTAELAGCGQSPVRDLQTAAHCSLVIAGPTQASEAQCSKTLDELIALAYRKMAGARGAESWSWRRLYTDASILRAIVPIAYLEQEGASDGEAVALSSIARLDHALVIAGAAGEGRYDLIVDIIALVQKRFLPWSLNSDVPCQTLPLARPSKIKDVMSSTRLSHRFNEPPSPSLFRRELIDKPFVISGFARSWPATSDRPWASLSYLRSVAGRGRVVPIEVGSDYRKDDWYQEMMPWEDFLANLAQEDEDGSPRVLYLAQHNLFSQFPALRDDIDVPDYVYCAPDAPVEYPAYKPPSNPEQLVLNAWLGPKGTISPAHTDPFFNFYVQVVGRKTVWLAPPSATPYMDTYPASSVASASNAHNPASNNTEPSMSNTSRVDVFAAQPGNSDAWAMFVEKVKPLAMHVVLEPGDALAFPPGWWHAMRSEGVSFSVSMWY